MNWKGAATCSEDGKFKINEHVHDVEFFPGPNEWRVRLPHRITASGTNTRTLKGMRTYADEHCTAGCRPFHLDDHVSPTPAQEIRPADPNASENARQVLEYLCDLSNAAENRLNSGHLARGSIGPSVPKGQDSGYRFTMDKIDYLQEVSGVRVGLIGADYCTGWIKSDDPLEATMY